MTGKCTSIRFERRLDEGCNVSLGVGVADMLVSGVVVPLPTESVAGVKTAEDSEASLDALRGAGGRFLVAIASGWRGIAPDVC